jgi:hypothetical protein
MPQMALFRDMTGTQGVDVYALNYHEYCHGRGSATQVTADSLEALGIDPRSENPLLPNAAILRGAEAIDAILNAADSGSSDVPNSMNAGRILCSSDADAILTFSTPLQPKRSTGCASRACAVCQLGGLIYFTLLGLIVLVLVNLLPVINFISQVMFDGCVACVDATTAKRLPRKLKKPASLSKPPSKRVKGTASAASDATDVSSMHLTAQQLRSIRRAHQEPSGAALNTGASFGQRLRDVRDRVVTLGEPTRRRDNEGARLLPQHETVSPPPPFETWA